MGQQCGRCGGPLANDGHCPRCEAAVNPPGGLLARRKAELDARWQQRVAGAGLSSPPLAQGFSPAAGGSAKTASASSAREAGNGLPRKRFDADVERVRFSGEKRFAEVLESLGDIPAMEDCKLPEAEEIRRQLKAQSLLLTESMAPGLHMAAKALAREFGIEEPIEIYQMAGDENAAMHFVSSPVILEIRGQILPRTDELMLRALVGHELGHYLAHGRSNPLRDYSLLCHIVLAEPRKSGKEAVVAACHYSMAQELTADRYGLLAAGNLDAALRLEMAMVSGLSSEAIILDAASYLAQARELMEEALANSERALVSTHPEHSLRAYAQWLFSESDTYRELTGQGPARLAIAEVDATLLRLLRIPGLDMAMAPDSRVAHLVAQGKFAALSFGKRRRT